MPNIGVSIRGEQIDTECGKEQNDHNFLLNNSPKQQKKRFYIHFYNVSLENVTN